MRPFHPERLDPQRARQGLGITRRRAGPDVAPITADMNRRFITVLLALSFSATNAACGSDDTEQAAPLALDGVYRPADQGTIASITFSGTQDYLLMPQGCSGGGCAEIGTYHLDDHMLVLENGTTHQTRSIALEVVKTSKATATLVQSVRPLDLVDPGEQLTRTGQETTTGGGQKVTGNGQQQLNGAASQLLQLIQQMIMNGQQMNRDKKADDAKDDAKDNAKPDEKPTPKSCKVGVPTENTPLAEAQAYFARCPNGP
jgi:hypothetical protein